MLTLSDALAPNSSSLSSVERTAQDDALERQMEQALWREAWTWREAQLGRQVAPDVDVERELWREAWNYRLAQLEAAKADQLFEQTTQALRQTHPAPLETVRAELSSALHHAVEEGGRVAFQIPCGVGKTRASAQVAVELWEKAFQGSPYAPKLPRIVIAEPTRAMAQEVLEVLRELGQQLLSPRALLAWEDTLSLEPTRHAGSCVRWPTLRHAYHVAEDAPSQLCQACPERPHCPFVVAARRPRGRVRVMTHAQLVRELPRLGELDLLIIDEDITSLLGAHHALSLTELAALKERGDLKINPLSWDTLCDHLAGGQQWGAEDLKEIMSIEALHLDAQSLSRSVLFAALRAQDDEECAELLAQAPDHRALHALNQACARGWQGCFVRQGVLQVADWRPLALERVRTTLYLDATTGPLHARATLGEGCQHVRFDVERPESLSITRVAWSASKHRVRRDQWRSQRDRERWACIHAQWESEQTAWVVHKSWREHEPGEQLKEAHARGHVLHYGAQRGSNSLQHCTTLILPAFHIPEAAKAARAELLALRTGAELAACDAEAIEVLEIGEMVQAAHRLRGLTRGSPAHLIILDERELPGLEANEVIDPDVLVWEHTGVVWGKRAYAEKIKRQVLAQNLLIPAYRKGVSSTPPCLHEAPQAERKQGARHPLKTYFHDDWELLAAEAGLTCTRLATSAGGDARVVLHHPDSVPRPDQLRRALASSGLRWAEWQGERLWLEEDQVLKAVNSLAHAEQITLQRLQEMTGLSRSSVYKRMKERGHTLDSLRQHKSTSSQSLKRAQSEARLTADPPRSRTSWNALQAPSPRPLRPSKPEACGPFDEMDQARLSEAHFTPG